MLLIDEDTCATNAMIRDEKMMQLVACEKEPITPFVRMVRPLYRHGISTVMVIGGTGDFFDVADHVLVMDCYKCHDATIRANEIVQQSTSTTLQPHTPQLKIFQTIQAGGNRFPDGRKYNPNGKVKVLSRTVIGYGDTEFNLAGLEQIVGKAQTNAISAALQKVASLANGTVTLNQVLSALEQALESGGLDALAPGQLNGAFARPRRLEVAGAINRMRRHNCIIQR